MEVEQGHSRHESFVVRSCDVLWRLHIRPFKGVSRVKLDLPSAFTTQGADTIGTTGIPSDVRKSDERIYGRPLLL
jgi:hypothetical protein